MCRGCMQSQQGVCLLVSEELAHFRLATESKRTTQDTSDNGSEIKLHLPPLIGLSSSPFFFIYISPIYIYNINSGEGIKAFARSPTLLVSCCIRFVQLYDPETKFNMRSSTLLALLGMLVSIAWSYPQKDGQVFSNEAIRQAQNTYLIPKDATIQKVQEGIEVAAYESIPGDEKINLFEILGGQVPPEVVSNLQGQIDQIGRS